jgi:hypothetical protein
MSGLRVFEVSSLLLVPIPRYILCRRPLQGFSDRAHPSIHRAELVDISETEKPRCSAQHAAVRNKPSQTHVWP